MASYISAYTGTQIDNAINKVKNNVYTKSETDTLLNAKVNTNDLSTVATSGSYNDLSNKPTFEYGEWTPEFICTGTSAINPTYTTSYTNSKYCRIENLVYVTFFIYANLTDIGNGTAHIKGLPYSGALNTDRQALSLSVKGSFSSDTVLTVTSGHTYIKIGLKDGGNQNWSTGNLYIGGSGCYLTGDISPSIDNIPNGDEVSY